MKKLVNIRIPILCALGLIVGIVAFHEFLFENFWILIVACALVTVGGVVFACLKRKAWIYFLLILLFIAVGFFSFMLRYNSRNQGSNECPSGVLTGRVTDVERNGNPSNTLYLENCSFEGDKVRGVVKVYVYTGTKYNTGDKVVMRGTLRNTYSIKDTIDTSDVRNNVYYEFTDAYPLEIAQGKLKLDEKIRLYIYNVTQQYMPLCGDVAYALLTGDRNALDADKTQAFQAAGIIHLLVVSGLHVNFIVFVFGFLLNKLKLKEYVQLPILLVPLLFYAYICNFSPSILRAIIMTVCLYLSRILYGRYDLLTSLCWAVIVILLTQPLYLYDIGFQLSAMSVFGIATVYLRINRALARRKINRFFRWIISTMSLSFSCVVATLFFNAYYFKSVALLGIVVNVFAIPLVFVAFVLTIVGLLPWVFHYVAWLADKILFAVVYVAKAISSLNATLPLAAIAVAMVVTPILLYIVGGYVNLRKVSFSVAVAVCSLALVACMVKPFIPSSCNDSVKVFMGYNDTIVVATSRKGEAVFVGEFDDAYTLSQALKYVADKNIKSAQMYYVSFDNFNQEIFDSLTNTVDVSAVYALDFTDGVSKVDLATDMPLVQAYPNALYGKDITVQTVFDSKLLGAVVKVGKISVALVTESGDKAIQFAYLRQDINYYIVKNQVEAFSDKNLATLSFYQNDLPGNFGANKYGNFTITEKDGTIRLNFRRN